MCFVFDSHTNTHCITTTTTLLIFNILCLKFAETSKEICPLGPSAHVVQCEQTTMALGPSLLTLAVFSQSGLKRVC